LKSSTEEMSHGRYFCSRVGYRNDVLAVGRDDGKGGIIYTEVRDCYREIEYDEEFEDR